MHNNTTTFTYIIHWVLEISKNSFLEGADYLKVIKWQNINLKSLFAI